MLILFGRNSIQKELKLKLLSKNKLIIALKYNKLLLPNLFKLILNAMNVKNSLHRIHGEL
jgi:hypothetical protein